MTARSKLTADAIVDEAIKLLDRDGPKQFSMRKLAARFSVDPMAIYYHIPNRAALMHRVIGTVVSRCELPEATTNWQDSCRRVCSAFRQLAHRHPGVIQAFDTFDDWVDGEHRISEALHKALAEAGFNARLTVRGARLLLSYTENFCAWELTDWITPYTPETRSELVKSLAQGDYPVTQGLLKEMTEIEPEAEFDFGLDAILLGLGAMLQADG